MVDLERPWGGAPDPPPPGPPPRPSPAGPFRLRRSDPHRRLGPRASMCKMPRPAALCRPLFWAAGLRARKKLRSRALRRRQPARGPIFAVVCLGGLKEAGVERPRTSASGGSTGGAPVPHRCGLEVADVTRPESVQGVAEGQQDHDVATHAGARPGRRVGSGAETARTADPRRPPAARLSPSPLPLGPGRPTPPMRYSARARPRRRRGNKGLRAAGPVASSPGAPRPQAPPELAHPRRRPPLGPVDARGNGAGRHRPPTRAGTTPQRTPRPQAGGSPPACTPPRARREEASVPPFSRREARVETDPTPRAPRGEEAAWAGPKGKGRGVRARGALGLSATLEPAASSPRK